LVVRAQALVQSALRLAIGQAPQLARRFESDLAVVDNHDRRPRRLARQHNGVMPGLLAGQREAAAGQRIVDPFGEGAFAHDGKLGGRRQRAPHEGTEDESNRRVLGQGLNFSRALFEQNIYAKSAAAQMAAQPVLVQLNRRGRSGRQIDAKVRTVISRNAAHASRSHSTARVQRKQ
jgi:hypothetical protein